MAQKRYLDLLDAVEIYRKSREHTDEIAPHYETDGAIDTLFDTEYDEDNDMIVFGEGCASFDSETGILTIEGQLVGDTIVIS